MTPLAPMSEEVRSATAERLLALGKSKSVALVEALSEGEACVQELADRIGTPHQTASYHLQVLRRAGVVSRRTDGPTSIYRIEDWSAWWIVQQMAGLVGEERD